MNAYMYVYCIHFHIYTQNIYTQDIHIFIYLLWQALVFAGVRLCARSRTDSLRACVFYALKGAVTSDT
jgi:hypothetical protein